MTQRFPIIVREAFKSLPDEASHSATQAPEGRAVFTPADHEGALDPHRSVVVGDRGTGKSFWSSVLINQDIKALVAKSYSRLGLDRVEGRLGFSDGEMAARHPSRSEIKSIMDNFSAEDLWRAVLLRFAPITIPSAPQKESAWSEWVSWVAEDPARRNEAFRRLDNSLIGQRKIYVLVLDALDTITTDWNGIRVQMKGLIRLALAVRALKAVRIKMFIRPDMADDRSLWAVGDASKLRHNEVELTWKRRDLYGLLWTLLANVNNDDSARSFRNFCASKFGAKFDGVDNVWRPPLELIESEDLQGKVFHALAGNFMGAGPRRGDTYKWVPNHLSDAAGFAAPRSFLLAMKTAAQETKSRETVLDKSGIESGARHASKIRVQELSEDYGWMGTVLEDMEGLVVPLEENDLAVRWRERGTLKKLQSEAEKQKNDSRYIPPGEVLMAEETKAYALLIEQLVRLKIFFRLADLRINMPDLFRLQAKVKRKGGMKPRA
ncbi:MAG: hypothetical protein ACP5M5_14115 [Acidibrevibacterium sp.]|uniref:hypothetical protein n=1 Tax=Acidibrevibacterium sp. TaxID=2606776 RepID=UPI003CFC6343